MEIEFFDVHTHVQFAAFFHDYQEVINRALKNKVGLINVGTQKETSQQAVFLSKKYQEEPIYATVGLHPLHVVNPYFDPKELKKENFSKEGEIFDYDFYKNLALQPKTIAIGECGLDYFRIKEKDLKDKQKEIFEKQIFLSFEVKKPLMLHCREAFDDLIDILKANKNYLNEIPGVVHFFSGNKEIASKLLDLGFYFSFGGVITFSRDYDDVLKYLPQERILSETDAPYVAPVPYRGQRNEPVYVIEVVKKISEIKNLNFQETKTFLLKNTKKIFNLT